MYYPSLNFLILSHYVPFTAITTWLYPFYVLYLISLETGGTILMNVIWTMTFFVSTDFILLLLYYYYYYFILRTFKDGFSTLLKIFRSSGGIQTGSNQSLRRILGFSSKYFPRLLTLCERIP